MDANFEYLYLSHLSITLNGLLIEEETIENLLGNLPYQFELKVDSDGLENHTGLIIINNNNNNIINK